MSRIYDTLPLEAGHASSSNSKCKSTICKGKIEKGSLRLSCRNLARKFDGERTNWYHEKCFFRKTKLPRCISEISNFHNLRIIDQKRIKLRIRGGTRLSPSLVVGNANRTGKRRFTARDGRVAGDQIEVTSPAGISEKEHVEQLSMKSIQMGDTILVEQNKKIWFFRDKLKQLNKKEILKLFKINNQFAIPGNENRLDLLADGLAFGALKPCSSCGWGQLVIGTGNYRCIARNKWAKCNELFQDPSRKLFLVPDDLKRNYEFLKEYCCIIEKRIFDNTTSGINVSSEPDTPSTPITVVAGAKSTAISKTKSEPHKVLVEIRDSTAVDPQSNKQWVSHVHRDANGNLYDAYLTRIDLHMEKNSYYKIQVLEPNTGYHKKCCWLFKAWGRIGTDRGDATNTEYLTLQEATKAFEYEFFRISGNEWSNSINFEKKPSKYSRVGVSYESSFSVRNLSQLDKTVQDLLVFIFDIDLMTKLLMEWELDLTVLPLGKLSLPAILEGFVILKELEKYIINNGEGRTDQTITENTNKFFAMIPHAFGNSNLPLLNKMNIIQAKNDLLDNLCYIEVAYSMLNYVKSADPIRTINSLYEQLRTNLQPVNITDSDPELETFKLYFKNSQAHTDFKLNLTQLFRVERYGEDERFTPFRSFYNTQLLWHGTRSFKIPGILSEGLMPPKGRPRTGCMFGNGIYFADRISKSAKYCWPNKHTPTDTGIILLCEVALGNMYELLEGEFIESVQDLPEGKNSVKGIGKTEPDPMETKVLENGTSVPVGIGISSRHEDANLDYNEFVIYDERQIKIRYLAWVKFEHTGSQS